MCLAIYQPVGVKVARDRLSNGWDNNPDGGGYAFIDELGNIQIRKFETWAEFVSGYDRDHRANTRSPFIIHERFATHGSKDEFNIHPFEIDEQTVLIHNGILGCVMQKDKRSDTRTFAEDYLAKLPHGWMDDDAMVDMVSSYIGRGNKLVILTNDPFASASVYIINEKQGHWDKGAWWSNDGYKPRWQSKKWTAYDRNQATNKAVVVHHPSSGKQSKPDSPVHSVKAGGLLDDGWTDDDWDDYYGLNRGYLSLCWLCGETLTRETSPVCFRCEWCTECSQEWWTCRHVEDKDLVTNYVRYYSDLDADDREVHDAHVLEMTQEAMEVVTDPEVVKAIEDTVRRA